MNNNIRISILGCGWLGLPLAEELIRTGYSVKGSATSSNKLSQLSFHKIAPFLVQFDPELKGDRVEEFFQCDVLIITIPPKRDPDKYSLQLEKVAEIISREGIKKVLFISSTSVYGNSNRELNESDPAIADSGSGKAILKAESLLINNPCFKTSVIRFGGLTGPGRYPARFLSGKTNVANGQAPVNLIHLSDCIGIIKAILKKDLFGIVFNACSPDHPSRQDFYALASQMAGLPEPRFLDELQEWKIISSIRISQLLGYDYRIKDWMGWLRSGQGKNL